MREEGSGSGPGWCAALASAWPAAQKLTRLLPESASARAAATDARDRGRSECSECQLSGGARPVIPAPVAAPRVLAVERGAAFCRAVEREVREIPRNGKQPTVGAPFASGAREPWRCSSSRALCGVGSAPPPHPAPGEHTVARNAGKLTSRSEQAGVARSVTSAHLAGGAPRASCGRWAAAIRAQADAHSPVGHFAGPLVAVGRQSSARRARCCQPVRRAPAVSSPTRPHMWRSGPEGAPTLA